MDAQSSDPFFINGPDQCWRPPLPNLLSTSPQQRVPPGPTTFPHHHSCSTAWPREIPPGILPPLFVRRVTMSPDLLPPPSDLQELSLTTLMPCTCKLHFCSKEGGDSDAGATPPTPCHCSTRGKVALPPIFVITTPPTAFNSSMAMGDACRTN